MDGFERFAQGHLITLFSATNYCGTAGNAVGSSRGEGHGEGGRGGCWMLLWPCLFVAWSPSTPNARTLFNPRRSLFNLALLKPRTPVHMQGAILVLGRDLVMVPKLIHPVPPSTPRTPDSGASLPDEEPPTPHPTSDTWMTQVRKSRARGLVWGERGVGEPPMPHPTSDTWMMQMGGCVRNRALVWRNLGLNVLSA